MFMILWVKGFDSALGIPCLKPPLERVRTETDSKWGSQALKMSSLRTGD